MSTPQLTGVKGIGPDAAAKLTAAGIPSPEALAGASIEQISAVPGFGPVRATVVRKAAVALTAGGPAEGSAAEQKPGTGETTTVRARPPGKPEAKKAGKAAKTKKGKKGMKEKKDKDKKAKDKKAKDKKTKDKKTKDKKVKVDKKDKKAKKDKKNKKKKK